MFDFCRTLVYNNYNDLISRMRIVWLTLLLLLVATAALFGAQGTGDVPREHLPDQGQSEALNTVYFEKRLVEIQWPLLNENSASVRGTLSEQLLTEIDATPLPVLVPAEHASTTDIKVRHTSQSLTVRVISPENSFVLYGSRAQYALPELRGIPGKRPGRKFVTVSGDEGVWTATWTEYGVSYMLRLGCSDSDQSCERYMLSIINSLTFVGGRP